MDLNEISSKLLNAFIQLATQPFYYIGIAIVILQYRRQLRLERKLFHTKIHSSLGRALRTLLWGWAAGLAASILMAFIGVSISFDIVVILWVITFLLIFIRIRYLRLAYSAGLLGIAHSILMLLPDVHPAGFIGRLADAVREAHIPSLLLLVGFLQLIEALFIRYDGFQSAVPLFFEGKRGKIVGGYQMYRFWPVPLFLLVPAQTHQSMLLSSPIAGGDLWSAGWTLIALPAMIGFAEYTLTRLPREKALRSSKLLLIYGIAMLLSALLSDFWPPATILASIAVILLHELHAGISRRREHRSAPQFVHDERGLKVLAVIPGGPAERMGILPGEIIHKVNGIKVGAKEQLHKALQANPAFCRMEIINHENQSKFVSGAIFAGDHHQLGIVLCPDEQAGYYVSLRKISLISLIRMGTRESAGKMSGGVSS
ncbi:PDZ domain-containing protein [Paenibacillaceae bacterium T2]|uniref:PDZ domain-containing protein n=2 Tax=Ferviditalea candida TaxID=3108399 RepID=A0ABU5ZIV0_9BACL|nr:PDZ domain-containing protein [Paenibacillaceae bacterium T2]